MNVAFAMRNRVKQQVGGGLAWTLGWGVGVALACSVNALAKDSSLPSAAEQPHIAADCEPLLAQGGARRAAQMSKVLVQSQGMRLIVQGCPFVRVGGGKMQQVLDVRVLVVDSETAANFVRGPLADGEEVDMGPVHLSKPTVASTTVSHAVAPAVDDEDVSPDVQFNRQWLTGLMQARGLQAIGGHWWAFAPSAARK